MEFKNVIEKRKSTRKFKSKVLSREMVDLLIDYARVAPSAANRQPWYFVILEKDKKDEVANIMEDQLNREKEKIKEIIDPTREYSPTSSVAGSIRVIKEVPIFILVFRNKDDTWKEGDYLSIGCAVEHISLGAEDLGLSSLWIRDVVYTREKIANYVGKSHMELVSGIALGYSDEPLYERKKKSKDEISEWL